MGCAPPDRRVNGLLWTALGSVVFPDEPRGLEAMGSVLLFHVKLVAGRGIPLKGFRVAIPLLSSPLHRAPFGC